MVRATASAGVLRSVLSTTVFVLTLFASAVGLSAQSWVADAASNGFTLKKVESDTAIATGQTFSYTIYYSIPAGATSVVITDVLPAPLEYLSSSYTSPCGVPTVSAPAVNSMGGTYSLSYASVPSGCSGSFTITVRFPNGVTCNNTTARNRVCLNAKLGPINITDLCTPYVSVRAIAVEPWNIGKWVTGAAWQGGPCPYATGDSVINYQICVYKDVGVTGQLNLVGGTVTDVLPTGAVLQSSTCGATQTGNVITWSVGAMSALPMYNSTCCTFSVLYPKALFPSGSQIQNQAVLTGTTGSPNQPCGQIADSSNKTCVEIKNIASATLSKWAYTNGQPGCAGKYLIYICNNGTASIPAFTVTDTVPAALTGLSVGATSAGLTVNLTGNIFTATSTSALAAGQCRWFEINFTIPATATVGSTITNCAWFTAVGMAPVQACNSFVVSAPAPTPCLWKEVCAEQPSYLPGSVFRYRLRIQNIGGQTMTGTTINDILNNNLTYVGNPSYYTGTAWNAPCQTTSNWTGVGLSYNSGTNTVTATIPPIPAVCQSIFYSACGMYGTGSVPYYFIEFDVKVVDTSALGNIPNMFTLSGGNLTASANSNIEYVTVVGTAGFTLQKGVKKTGPGAYATTVTTSAGSSISYQLKFNVATGSVALRHITMADLLPLDNSTDQLILGPCSPRGSVFNTPWTSALSSSPPASPYNNAGTMAKVNNFAPTGAPGVMFIGGCGSAVNPWNPTISAGAKNLGYYFGSAPVAATFSATSEFNASVPLTATNQQVACNTFAANAAVRHLISSSIISDQKIGELESPTACVTVQKEGCLDSLKATITCDKLDANGYQTYSISIAGWNANSAGVLMLSSPDGTFSPASFPVAAGAFSLSTTFTDVPPVTGMVKIYLTLVVNGVVVCRDSILRDLPPCPHEPPEDCCKEFQHKIDQVKIIYNNAGNVGLSAIVSAGPSPMKKFVATIVSVQRRQVCNNVAQPWQRAFGDIIGGGLTSSLTPGPLLLSLYSREAQWGPGECLPFSNVGLVLKMIFPAVPVSFKCHDTLIFAIRYSFTDCKCVTCDFVRYDTVVRRYKFLPWDNGDIDHGSGIGIRRNDVAKSGESTQADTADYTSLVMSSKDTGTLWIVNSADPDNEIHIQGAEITSSAVQLMSVTSGVSTGIIAGETAFISLSSPPGTTLGVDLGFDNSASTMQWPVNVRYLFSVGADGEPQYSELLTYIARAPGADPDEADEDAATKPNKVRSYVMYFKNANGYNEHVYSFRIRSTGAARILAVGPAGTDATQALLAPVANQDGSYMITAVEHGATGVAPNTEVKPIYLTLSEVEGALPFEFESYDGDGQFISNGTFELSDPIAGVDGDVDPSSSVRMVVHPNPTSTTAVLSVYAENTMRGVEIVVRDMQGRIVVPIRDGTMEAGNHVIQIRTELLSSGTYYIVMTTPEGIVTRPWTVVK